jgi:transcription elongation factor Elf1
MEHIPGYDGWKLSTPWDDEREISVSFECKECDEENETEIVVGGRSGDADVECEFCGKNNVVSFGNDE